jgi:sarcosine oxidase
VRRSYEYVVVGCGGIGCAAAYWLSREAGDEVLCLERFHLGHDRGGSEDHSRLIRLSYHTPEYTALTPHTYEAWAEVEEESGVRLVVKTGGLDLEPVRDGRPGSIDEYADSMRAAKIPFEELCAQEVMGRFPQFKLGDDVRALYQAQSGLVDASKANAVHVGLARARGATVLENTPVRGVRPVGDGAEVETDRDTFFGRRLVVTAGAWTNEVLGHVGVELPITLTQEQVTYFRTPQLREFAPDRFPVWIWHGGPDQTFYGVPVYGEVATKAGQDAGGDEVTLQTRTFEPNRRVLENLRRFLERYIPGSLGPELYTKTCLYDIPPDRNFILDKLPEHPQILVAVGAGHAFKFAGLMGRILSELATGGETRYPIGAFRLDRPALTDPTYRQVFAL